MKITPTYRYNCDFCGKKSYSKGHMRKHEARCTLNMDRVCAMHSMIEGKGVPPVQVKDMVAEAKAALPTPSEYGPKPTSDTVVDIDIVTGFVDVETTHSDEYPGLREAIASAMPAVRLSVDNCPACILAAIRQKAIPAFYTEFDFKAECKAWFDEKCEQFDSL